MRVVKLSPDRFANEIELQRYFAEILPSRVPPGLFLFGNQIGENELDPGETLLFFYGARLRYVAKAETGRMDNTYIKEADQPHCFVINLRTVRQVEANISLQELENRLRNGIDFQKSLLGHGWTKVPDSEQAEQLINDLIG